VTLSWEEAVIAAKNKAIGKDSLIFVRKVYTVTFCLYRLKVDKWLNVSFNSLFRN